MPEAPYGLKVLDKSGRTVQLSWAAPYDGNSPIKKFLIEYKHAKGNWEKDIDRHEDFVFTSFLLTYVGTYVKANNIFKISQTEFSYLEIQLKLECSACDLPPHITSGLSQRMN